MAGLSINPAYKAKRFKISLPVAESRWIFYLLYCTAAYFILLNIFSGSSETQRIDHIYTSIFLTTLILAGWVNSWIIRTRYLKPDRFLLFVLFSFINILLWTFLNQLLFDHLIDYILPGYYFISYYDFKDLLKFFFVYVTLITLLDLSWEWFQLQETRHKLVLVEKEKIDAELKALTNQVNPHFLFNSLTVLYSLSLKNSREAAPAIIKLSDILRYVIYDSSRGEVPLKSEVALIRNYIDLQRYRVPESASISFNADLEDENLPVVPMLFLPLVENSFKHGINSAIANTFIEIRLKSAGGVITFHIANNKKDEQITGEIPGGGIGLKNIEGRLNLMYRDKHSFSVYEKDTAFHVELKLNTR